MRASTAEDRLNRSVAEELAELSPEELQAVLAEMPPEEARKLMFDWSLWARPKQLPPTDREWSIWLNLAGRGSGKTRTGAETCRAWVDEADRKRKPIRIALIAETAADARDVLVEGESGILAISPPWNKPKYSPANRRLTWPNGCQASTFAGDEPDQLRGPQHHKGWCDELAKYRYAQETWDNFELGLRLGDDPQAIITTTPRPIKLIKDLVKDPDVVVTRGSSYENISNLAPRYIKRVINKYEGTRLGRQELHAEVLEDMSGALWDTGMIERNRILTAPNLESMKRIVVAVDPAVTSNEDEGTPNDTGIVVCALGQDGSAFMLKDASGIMSPAAWGAKAVRMYRMYGASVIVGERNQGGEMVRSTLTTVDPNANIKLVWAAQGKTARAQPISALTEQNRIKFVGAFPELEDQLMSIMSDGSYSGPGSPDRADAFVWAMTELMEGHSTSYDPADYASYRAE